ncbi:DNA polymerase III subunit delta' [Vibrio ichthyoenteri ATCC 700023]|uniref:DNA polymerase III subunit delta' n=1 Tax=Vibrio ichthyoenteri ATCC 700023 TaxID=870968 RepID=F9S6F6_9VIBR|nr:DNA polymerase III subunit delta' [Vibrio ichthyoenteri]EGU33303.1 DNA polymerase III subunit delta' [Vibrio ichthyoenteri ATCC 700023]
MTTLYPWLAPLWQQWQNHLEADRFPNAALLIAKPGFGEEQLVTQFSRAVMCSNYAAQPCGFCHSCQLMASSNHPDFHLVVPEKEGKAITVEQIRHCNRIAQESSQQGGYRLIVIQPADSMNESAANALLKTLETPAKNCLFLLVATSVSQLLPTITSRCQQWHVGEPDAQALTDWLASQVNGEVPSYAAHLNGHSPLKTLHFIEQKEQARYLSIEKQLLAVIGQQGDIIKLSKELASEAEQSLHWLWYLLTDAQKVHFGLTASNGIPGASDLAQQANYSLLYNQAEALRELIEQLKAHSGLNRELLILDWLIKFNGEVCL